MADDLNAMAVFVAVAEAKGFRAAGERLGVTASAVSQTIRKLEEQLDVVLVQRTTYPQRRHASPALRAFIDHVRRPGRRGSRKRQSDATGA
jgi:DNA-binding transcriptional LysR family regulator